MLPSPRRVMGGAIGKNPRVLGRAMSRSGKLSKQTVNMMVGSSAISSARSQHSMTSPPSSNCVGKMSMMNRGSLCTTSRLELLLHFATSLVKALTTQQAIFGASKSRCIAYVDQVSVCLLCLLHSLCFIYETSMVIFS